VFELAWTHSQVSLRQLNASEADAQLYAAWPTAWSIRTPTLRAQAGVLLRNRRGQSGLWGYAISGDLPIVLLQVGEAPTSRWCASWCRRTLVAPEGPAVDLVIWNEERDVYRQRLQEQILGLIAGSIESHVVDRPGGIFVRHAEQIALEDRVLLQSVARAIISDRLGSLAEQVGRKRVPSGASRRSRRRARRARCRQRWRRRGPALLFDNGIGGFAPDGREYVVAPPPASGRPHPGST
jgi:cellobiose phosphorylase